MEDLRRVCGVETEYAFRMQLQDTWYPIRGEKADPMGNMFGNLLHKFLSPELAIARGGYTSSGARMYWDQHPEVCTAESDSISEVVSSEIGSERELYEALQRAVAAEYIQDFDLKRRVVDDQEQWGRHENYMVAANIYPQEGYRAYLDPLAVFFAFRSLITGAGYVDKEGFRIAQKASHATHDFHRDTVSSKPLINTRFEALADESRWKRLHVPCVDITNPHVTAMGMGVTSLFLRTIEMGNAPRVRAHWTEGLPKIARAVSADLTMTERYSLEMNGCQRQITAIDYHEYVAEKLGRLVDVGMANPQEGRACEMYMGAITVLRSVTDEVSTYKDPVEAAQARDELIATRLAGKLDWARKYSTLVRCAQNKGIEGDIFESAKIKALDLALDTVGTASRTFPAYAASQSAAAQEWAPEERVTLRRTQPPQGRASNRGEFIKATTQWPENVSVDWGYLSLSGVEGEENGVLSQRMGNPFGDPEYDAFVERARRANPRLQHNEWIAI